MGDPFEALYKRKDDAKLYIEEDDYDLAIKEYVGIKDVLRRLPVDKFEIFSEKMSEIEKSCNLNLTLCYLKTKSYDKCIDLCNDPSSLLRIPIVSKLFIEEAIQNISKYPFFKAKGFLNDALEDIEKAKEKAGNDKGIIQLYNLIVHDLNDFKVKEKAMGNNIKKKLGNL